MLLSSLGAPCNGLVPSGTIVRMTSTTDRRPRIRKDVAEKIDRNRGSVPFERYVNSVLELGDGPDLWLERTKDRDLHRLRGAELRGNAYGLVEATDRMEFLNHIGAAIAALDKANITETVEHMQDAFDNALAAVEELYDAAMDDSGMESVNDE